MGSLADSLKGLPVVRTVVAVQERYGRDGAGMFAGAIAYHAFISVFPLLILGLAAIGFVLSGRPDMQQRWTETLAGSIPGLRPIAGDVLDAAIENRTAVGIGGLAALAWTGTAIVRASGFALSRIFRFRMYASLVKSTLWALGSLVGLGALAIASIGVTSFAGRLEGPAVVDVALVALGLGIDFALFLIAYRVLTQRRGPALRDLWQGAALVAVGWTILKLAGSWYASRTVANSQAVYGTFAATIGVLVMLSLAARMFLYGAELNAIRIDGGGEMEEPEDTMIHEGNGHRADRSAVALVRDIASDTGTLIRQEVHLARQEVVEGILAKVVGVGAFGMAGVFAVIALVFAGLAAAAGLQNMMTPWGAWLIVMFGYVMLAGIAGLAGLATMKRKPIAPTKAIETTKEDVEWAKAQLKR